MKFTLIALLATAATVAHAQATDKFYVPYLDQTCTKVMVGEHDADLECEPGHIDNAPIADHKNLPPQARAAWGTSEVEERDADSEIDKRGSCALGHWACALSCWHAGCSGARCRGAHSGVCSCTC